MSTLPTELVVLKCECGVTSSTHYGCHGDLPDSQLTVVLEVLLNLLDVQRGLSARGRHQLAQKHKAASDPQRFDFLEFAGDISYHQPSSAEFVHKLLESGFILLTGLSVGLFPLSFLSFPLFLRALISLNVVLHIRTRFRSMFCLFFLHDGVDPGNPVQKYMSAGLRSHRVPEMNKTLIPNCLFL